MNYSHPQRMDFNFEGQFLGFAGERGKFKYLRLGMLSEEVEIKIPKELRTWVGLYCQPGTAIQVTGIGKFDRSSQTLKLKASQINPVAELTPSDGSTPASHPLSTLPPTLSPTLSLSPAPSFPSLSSSFPPLPTSKPTIKILVCQKSGCLKKGGKGLCENLENTLRDRNLHHHVTIQKTGCMKRCSGAPNLVVMPGKHEFKKIRPGLLAPVHETITRILEKHRNQG